MKYTKNIFAFLLMGIFMISMASAFEFDNVKTYDPISREVTITNAFGMGDEIGKARLNTPLNIKVASGYQKVAEFDLSAYQDYSDVLKQFTFTNMKNKKNINRDFDIRYKTIKKIKVEDYTLSCVEDLYKNGSKYNKCENIKTGSHEESKEVWTKAILINLNKNEVLTIGIFTNVQKGDYVDWIPTIYGVEVEEWATWTESLAVDNMAYWNLDEVSGTIYDSTSNNIDSAIESVTYGATGVLNNALDFESGSSNVINFGNNLDFISSDAFSISSWIKMESTGVDNYILTKGQAVGEDGYTFSYDSFGRLSFDIADPDSSAELYAREIYPLSAGIWYHYAVTYDGSGTQAGVNFYINGTKIPATDGDLAGTLSYDGTTADLLMGQRIGLSYFDGLIDETAVFSRELAQADVTELYGSGTPPEWTDDFDANPSIILNSPTSNATYSTWETITFNFTASDDIELSDVKIYVNDILNQTNATGLNNTNYLFDLGLQDGEWLIYGKATDNESQETTTETINITIDTTPFIEFITPPTLVNYANITQEYIPMKVNVSTPYFFNLSYYLENANGTSYTQYFENETYDINFTDMPDAHYHYNVTICTTTNQCNSTETRHINHDATSPIITSAYNLTDLTTLILPLNSTWHYNATDENIDSCYYNSTANASQTIITCNSTINTTWTTGGNKTITFCANDTFGNENCNTEYIYVYYLQETQTESPDPIAESFDATFDLLINLTNIPTTTATLILNNTAYSPTISIAGTNGYYFRKAVTIPDGWGNTTGITQDWYWNYTIDGVTTNKSTTIENITVYELAVDNCSSYGEIIFNFSVLDEEMLTPANESETINVEADLILTSKSDKTQYISYSDVWSEDNNPQICVPSGVINNSQYWIDLTIGFSSTDRVWEFFYIDSGTLNSTKIYESFNGLTDQDVDLMDLATADSTSFLFNYFDVDGLAVDGSIVHVMRKYIGDGKFREVERSKQDQNGDTIVHLVEEDVIYYFLITKEGMLLHTSSEYTALCQATPCTIQIEASGGSATFPTNWDLIEGGGYTITSSGSTREVTLTYLTNQSSTMNFTVYKYNSDGSYSIVDEGVNTGLGGSIPLTIPQVAGNVSFFATVIQNDDFINSEWVNFEQDAIDYFGATLSVFLGALIILSLGLFAVSEGVGTIVYVILGIIISGALGLIITDLSTGVNIVIYLVIAGGILLWKLTGGRR